MLGTRRDVASYRASRPPAVPVLTAREYAPAAVAVYLKAHVSVTAHAGHVPHVTRPSEGERRDARE